MIAWMLYSAIVALIVAAAGRAAEWLARLAGYRVRWIWAGALALTAFLSASAALRELATTTVLPLEARAIDVADVPRLNADVSWHTAVSIRIERVRQLLDAPLRDAVAMLHRAVSPRFDLSVGLVSLGVSVALALVLIGVGRRFRRARRGWPVVAMQGVDVRLAPRIGPVVLGLVHPEIVVPRWLLARHADEQRLVVTHEDEHVRARDPLLLALSWGAVIATPWNPAVWYMVSRLRLAVELDCDARVLRRGAAPRSYGSLLIDVAQHASALRLSALALADDSSHLHQRILAMKPSIPRFARIRGGLAAAFALAGVLVACQATLPTDAEIERMDVATATRTARELAKGSHADTAIVYTIDGVTVPSSQALALMPSELGAVQVVTGTPERPTRISIDTRGLRHDKAEGRVTVDLAAAAKDSGRGQLRPLMKDGTSGPAHSVELAPLAKPSRESFTGLIFIDGVPATDSQMRALDRTQIESVEILKGLAAARAFNDPAAANGVITITTKGATIKK